VITIPVVHDHLDRLKEFFLLRLHVQASDFPNVSHKDLPDLFVGVLHFWQW
jgi:hypothetical protein